ncbi:hypothetical protein [Spiroplasma clarkii]|nr:hypothetical protein [Spiroplasma clarkii]
MNLAISNNSRSNIIYSFFLCSFLYLTTIIVVNFFVVVIPELIINQTIASLLVKNTFVLSLYGLFIGLLLFSFLTFAFLFFNKNIALMVSVLILTFQFVSAIPQKFHDEKNPSIFIPFYDQTSMSVERIRNVIDLQKNIKAKNIRYPNLSAYINSSFLEGDFKKGTTFARPETVLKRTEIWEKLGLTNDQTTHLQYQNLELARRAEGWPTAWANNSSVDLNIIFIDEIIDLSALEVLVENATEYKEILREFYNFVIDIQTNFSTTLEFQSNYWDLFDVFQNVLNTCDSNSDCTDEQSYVKNNNLETNNLRGLTTLNLTNLYQNYFYGQSGLALRTSDELTELVTQKLFNPVRLAVRILENYFIESTSDFNLITSVENINPVVVTDQRWIDYQSSVRLNNLLYILNPVATTQSIYTTFTSESSEDIWFEYKNRSNIIFTKQQNIFMTYPRYSIVLNRDYVIKNDTYNEVSQIWVFILIQTLFLLFFLGMSINKFNRLDLN